MSDRRLVLALPLLLLAAVALGLLSWRFGSGEARAASASADNAEGASAGSAGADASRTVIAPSGSARSQMAALEEPRAATGSARARAISIELTDATESAIDAALETASSASQGKANAGNCTVAVLVIDAESGEVLVERAAAKALAPASNMKLVTTLAALMVLGSDWSFETALEAQGRVADGLLEGDLVVRAGGDPFFVSGDPDAAAQRVGELAELVERAGIQRVSGDLVLDLGSFESPGPAAGWPRPDGFWTQSYALAAGLSVQAGLITAQVESGARADDWAEVRVTPSPSGLSESFGVRTSLDAINDVRIGLVDARLALEVSGKFGPTKRHFDKTFRHPDPIHMFSAVLLDQLSRRGVRVDGVVTRSAGSSAGRPLGSVRSGWLDLLEPVNADSVNSLADTLLMAIGAERFGEGSRRAGARAVRDILGALELELEDFNQADGSGLSRDNRVSASMISELLCQVLEMDSERRHEFLTSLALMGETGTLDDRMRGTAAAGRVRAKSGWINGASALSGIATTLSGRELVFSILVEYPRVDGLNTKAWKPMQERIVEALVNWRPQS